MSNLEKFYSSFGGVDTRSNKLLMDKTTFRNGSKNFRYNFQDEIQKANGFQHKSQATPVDFVDIFEYKFSDLETGQEKSELLAVGVDGNLYRKKDGVLKWLTHGAFASYSFYYDETTDDFALAFLPAGPVVHFGESLTGLQLKAVLNTYPGVSVEFETSAPAYLLDCVIENPFKDNAVYYWEVVPHPNIRSKAGTDGTLASYTIVQTPFETTVKAQTDPTVKAQYEGISAVNLNNSIYITDGGFVYKYDGKCVYRAGMPRTQYPQHTDGGGNFGKNGIKESWQKFPGTGSLPWGAYFYKYRFGFTDANGMTIFGEIRDLSDYVYPPQTPPTAPTQGAYLVECSALKYGKDFPVFSAKVVGNQGNTTGAGIVLNVASGHNILPGMIIRQVTNATGGVPASSRNTFNAIISFYAKVTSVAETTITLASIACNNGENLFSSVFLDGDIVTGYFTQKEFEGRLYDKTTSPAGAFLQIFRTKTYPFSSGSPTVDDWTYAAKSHGPFYHVYDMPIPINDLDTSKIIDGLPDAIDIPSNRFVSLTELLDDAGEGFELPRACKSLTVWQDLLVQLGRPADTSIKDRFYPSNYLLNQSSSYCQLSYDSSSRYTEALLCDYQSVYWNDPNAPEGFPQDGLHEFKVQTAKNDAIRGAIENKDALIAIKEKSTSVISGDVGANTLSMETLEDDIGLGSFKTLKDVGGTATWLDPNKGFYSLIAGRLPVAVGWAVSDQQRNNYAKLDYSKATAANFDELDLYICAVGTTWFVFDYSKTSNGYRNCWYIWERMPAKSLVAMSDGKFYALTDRLWKMKTTNTRFDFTDHRDAIEMRAPTAWLNWSQPTVDKNFERIWINSIQGGFNLTVEQYGNYLDEMIGAQTITMVPGSTKKTVKEWIKCIISKLSGFSFAFVNNEKNTFVRIQGFELEWSPGYDSKEPRR